MLLTLQRQAFHAVSYHYRGHVLIVVLCEVEHDRRRFGETSRRRTLSGDQEPLIVTAEEEPPSGPGLSMTMLRLG